jgi:1-acyl-sn-glycerol-3-phosphate acyltransferase
MLPAITHRFPRPWGVLRWVGWLMLRVLGWRLEGEAPPLARAVVIAAPHTSNWDFVIGLAAAWAYGIRWSWLGKDALFRWPWGGFMRWTGGLAVDRSKPHGLVGEVVEVFERSEALMLLVPAEGTRGWSPYWRSGFYWMAVNAKVPIVCGFLDFSRRQVGFGSWLEPTGDIKQDMDRIRAFYQDKRGKFPELAGPVRLKAEDEAL